MSKLSLEQEGNNRVTLHVGDAAIHFSYGTPVAVRVNGRRLKTPTWHSMTTAKHIGQMCPGAIKATREEFEQAVQDALRQEV